MKPCKNYFAICLIFYGWSINAQELIPVDYGWAGNSINTSVFRKHSITSFRNTQFIAFYNADGIVVLGKRSINSKDWHLKKTQYKGNVADAHNAISIAVDGDGFLHVAWDHHGNKLRYCKSVTAGSLELTKELSMTGSFENMVTYPEFYNLPKGNLLFFYRDGSSGSGNLVLNSYNVKTKSWTQLHNNLIDGEKKRNAYWQACIDAKGTIHLSWVWRDSPDVASNHDLCYARSNDGGKSWQQSTGEIYQLPITAATAEYAWKIPQSSELINQTSMTADHKGNPFIATYWRDSSSTIPQYRVVYKNRNGWQQLNTNFRKTPFSLSGQGTKRIPISRPQIIVWKQKEKINLAIIFRDAERQNRVSVATNSDILRSDWKIFDLDKNNLGSWEPTFDHSLWQRQKKLHLFVQHTEQTDGEGLNNFPPQMIYVLQYTPN